MSQSTAVGSVSWAIRSPQTAFAFGATIGRITSRALAVRTRSPSLSAFSPCSRTDWPSLAVVSGLCRSACTTRLNAPLANARSSSAHSRNCLRASARVDTHAASGGDWSATADSSFVSTPVPRASR